MTPPNQDQAEYWGGANARRWIALDAPNERLLARFTNALLDAADLSPGASVMDVGCGTGETTIAAARRVGGGAVTGLDISKGMLERARARTEQAGLDNVTYVHGDAQVYVHDGATRFDRMISRFGVMFFADTVAAFRNIAAALRPGATLTFLCWGDREANPWFTIPGRIAAAHFGASSTPADPTAPGPMAFADHDRILRLMSDAGLARPEVAVLDLDLDAGPTIEEAMQYANLGPIAMMMREHAGGEADFAAMKAAFAEALKGFLGPDGIRVPARCNLFSARAA